MTDAKLLTIRDRLSRPGSVDEVRTALAELDRLATTEPILDGMEELRQRAIHCLREITSTDPLAAAAAIRSDLLPRCLVITTYDGPKRYSPYPEWCGAWIDDLPEEYRIDVREEAVQAALVCLSDDRARSALVLLAAIGYAHPTVLTRLDELLASDDNRLGDHALAVRASLGLPPERIRALRAELHRRIAQRWTVSLVSALDKLGDSSTLALLFSTWLAPDPANRPRPAEPHLLGVTMGIVPTIATRYPAGNLATRAWEHLLTLQSARLPVAEYDLEQRYSLGPDFDSRAVVPALLRLAAGATGLKRYSLYRQLKECVRPTQLLGWDDVPVDDLAVVRADAGRPTGMEGRGATIGFHQQSEAWNVILSVGRPELIPSISDTVAAERNGYACGELLELSACLEPMGFPPTAASLLKGQAPD